MMNYDSILSKKIKSVKPSGIRKYFDLAATMQNVISLGVGEPDFQTPWHIREAGIRSLELGKTRYTSNAGLIELRKSISDYVMQRQNVSYDPQKEILVSVGGSEAIDVAIRAVLNAGDEVLIPEPSFVCYTPITVMADGIPVPIVTKEENCFRITAEELREKITPKTKLLILPYPNNPTGGIMRREHLEEIAEVLRGTDIIVLADEIYSELTFGGEKHCSIVAIDGMRERTILVSGFSKTYSMTGWRIGFACAPEPIAKAMTKLHQFCIMSAPTTAQYAAIEAMRNGDYDIEKMKGEYDMRRKLMVKGLRSIGLRCFEPEGAFYVFPSIRSTGLTSDEFCERLLKEQRVAVVPGPAFGESGEGFVRISYCYSTAHLTEALKRMDTFIKGLK